MIWNVLGAKRLAGLKFRRQHPIGPFLADFACVERHVIVELDGGFHDYQYEKDSDRQAYFEAAGWQVIRFSNEDVFQNVDAVAIRLRGKWEWSLSFEGNSSNYV